MPLPPKACRILLRPFLLINPIRAVTVTAWVAIVGTLCVAQDVERHALVLVKEVQFSGDLGASPKELHDYTEFLVGHPLERKKILEQASSAITMLLRQTGYWKAQVTPELHSLGNSRSKDQEVSLEVVVKAGRRYRVQDLNFVGLSGQVTEADLNQSCSVQRGEVANMEEVATCIRNLQARFQKTGQDVYVIPTVTFDDAASTVSLQFDIRK